MPPDPLDDGLRTPRLPSRLLIPNRGELALRIAELAGGELQSGIVRGVERTLRSICREVERKFSIAPSQAVVYGRASHAILEAQSAYRPDLLVVGAQGESESGPARSLGGTTLKLLRHSTVPMLVVRRLADNHYRRVLIGVGDSALSGDVLAAARLILGSGHGVVVHAFDAPLAKRVKVLKISGDTSEAHASELQALHRQTVAKWLKAAKLDGNCEVRVLRGHPQAVLIAEIRRVEPDLVVLGKHEAAPTDHDQHIGSTVLRIAYSTTCDLLQVPQGER